MRPVWWVLLFVLTQTLGCAAGFVTRSGQIILSSETSRDLARGVFEVVVPKLEHETVEYKQPLPVDLLPFDQRNDKFMGIGTAFAISPTRFVTAAHVLPTYFATSQDRYYLRDFSGATYEIGRITKYSQYRDLVEFELVQAPAHVVPLEIAPTVAIGEPVATVGNARGEGVIPRSGAITSVTPEPMAGRWKFLRFTAPASPGNSGGPLVDSSGRVLGVVVRKSEAENLNFAVPIGELESLSSTQSEYWVKGIPIEADQQQLLKEWKFASPLPASLPALGQAAQRSYSQALATWASEFETKFKAQIFPNHPDLQVYLRDPFIPFGLGRFFLDGNGKWEIAPASYKNKELTSGQWAHFFEGSDKSWGEVLLGRPRGVALSMFFESPKAIADAIVHNDSWTTNFANRRIGIETLGQPSEKERWVDDYGRPWFNYVWELKRSDEALVVNCLTSPGGWACLWKKVRVGLEESVKISAKRFAARVTLSHHGRVKDWVEFLALPETYKPKLLAGAVVQLGKNLSFELGPFSGSIDVPLLSENSVLEVFPSPDPAALKEQRLVEVRLTPRSDKAYAFVVHEALAPLPNSSERYLQFWQNLQASSPPYDNVPIFDGKANVIRRAVKTGATRSGPAIYLYDCRSGSEDPQAELKVSCDKFQETFKIVAARTSP